MVSWKVVNWQAVAVGTFRNGRGGWPCREGGDAVSCVSVVTWMDMHGMAVCTCSAVGVGGCWYWFLVNDFCEVNILMYGSRGDDMLLCVIRERERVERERERERERKRERERERGWTKWEWTSCEYECVTVQLQSNTLYSQSPWPMSKCSCHHNCVLVQCR